MFAVQRQLNYLENYRSMSFSSKNIFFILFPLFLKTLHPDLAQTCNAVLLLTSLSANKRHVRQLNRQISTMRADITWEITRKGKRNVITQAEKLLVKRQFIFTMFIIFRLEGGETPDGFRYYVDWWINKNTLIWLVAWMSYTWTGNDLLDRSSLENGARKKIFCAEQQELGRCLSWM